eukprot:7471607-Lingulodinium_polyedra.AAC.1
MITKNTWGGSGHPCFIPARCVFHPEVCPPTPTQNFGFAYAARAALAILSGSPILLHASRNLS